VDFFGEVVRGFGLPTSAGQIYGLLYGSPKPLSFSDIVERLEISKGSASQGIHLLRSLGAIRQVLPSDSRMAGRVGFRAPVLEASRRDYYEPELGLRRLVGGVLRERVAPLTAAGADGLARLRELAERDDESSDFYLERIKQLETWRRRLKTVLPVFSVLLGPKSRK
jgi:hypothetical protein